MNLADKNLASRFFAPSANKTKERKQKGWAQIKFEDQKSKPKSSQAVPGLATSIRNDVNNCKHLSISFSGSRLADSTENSLAKRTNKAGSPELSNLNEFALEGFRIEAVNQVPRNRSIQKPKRVSPENSKPPSPAFVRRKLPAINTDSPIKLKPTEEVKAPQPTAPCDFDSDAPTSASDIQRPKTLTRSKSVKSVMLLEPVYSASYSTVFFEYPPQCRKEPRDCSRVNPMPLQELNSKPLNFRISDNVHTYNSVVNALKYNGFQQVSNSTYNVLIASVPKPDFLRELSAFQKTNHFPGIWNLGRKDNLWRNISKMKRKFGKEYEICPLTFILPEDYKRFLNEREEHPKALWIMKPSASSCGRGIKILSKKTHVTKRNGQVISKYVSKPHTINGFKYDLRLYVCVTSFDPLRIYFYKEGLVRFATEAYTGDKKHIKKRFMHLTNFSVNKKSDKFVKNQDSGESQGSKWSLEELKAELERLGENFEEVLKRIYDVIIKTCISVEPHVVNTLNQCNKRNCCFETYGFDILLDHKLKPWLLEVNVSPSLSSSSPLDKRIKTSLMCDTFNLAGIVPYDRKNYDKVLESQKTNRLLGIEKNPKLNYRNVNTLASCTTLEEAELSEEDFQVLLDTEEEFYRKGFFRRIFPNKSNIDYYSQFFPVARYNNLLLWKHMKSSHNILLHNFKRLHEARPV